MSLSLTASRLARLRTQSPVILPSLLLCDFAHLADELQRLEQAGATALHLDVMDGHFVPNCTYGLTIVEACRRVSNLPLDVHLMISNPAQYIQQYRTAGADLITIHIEATTEPAVLLDEIHQSGAGVGLALNPPTPLSAIEPYLKQCDLVLAMSVMPGFGGQQFDRVALDKLAWLKNWSQANQHPLLLEVDGGVNASTITACGQAGANMHVVGSGIFKQPDYATALRELRTLASQ